MTDAETNVPTPDPALGRLDPLVGDWTMTGHLVGSSEENIVGRASFRWLPGGFFLQQEIEIDPLDATFEGTIAEDGSAFSGGWRPRPGADETINVAYDVTGSRVA